MSTNDILFIADKHNSKFNAEPRLLLDNPSDNDAQGIPDKIRYNTGHFWCRGDTNLQELDYSTAKVKQFFDTKYSTVHRQVTISDIQQEQQGASSDEWIQYFTLRFNADTAAETSRLRREFVTWLDSHHESGQYYEDHCTEVSLYEKSSNKTETSMGLVDMYCKVKYEYNYHHLNYEEMISDSSIEEYELPNFYSLVMRQKRVTQRAIISLFNQIPIPDEDERFLPSNEYFNKWARHYKTFRESGIPPSIIRYHRVLSYSRNSISNMNDSFKFRELFPMYSTIEFTTDTNCEMGSILEETKFAPILRNHIFQRQSVIKETSEIRVDMDESESYNSTQHFDSIRRRYWDVNNFFREYEFEELEDSAYFDSDVELTEENRAYYNLMALIIQGKIQKIKKEKYRKFTDILDGKLAHSEPVIYIVDKRNDQGDLLQTFNFTNTEKTDIIKFVDSQVKYNSKYEYSLRCLSIIVGTKYRYKDLRFAQPDDVLSFRVESKPDMVITEVDLMKNSVWIMDNPPVNPDVEIIPIVGENDKIRIHLRSPTGRFKKKPIIFSESENEMIEKLREAQDISDSDEEIVFESDDNIDRFIMYRTDFLPTNHMQFELHGKKREISTADDFITGITGRDTRGVTASLLDDISPNKKYYYCFRSIDIHGNHSYPSEIYKVEIVDDHGSIYPIIEICELKKPDTRQVTKSFKRFMYISPALRNLTPDDDAMRIDWSDEESGPSLGGQVALGVGEEKTWGRKFKVRLKSKTTARVLDFNFRFIHEHKFNNVDDED